MELEVSKHISLTNIIKIINNLKIKINKYYDKLSRNEALTRYALIDPLLRALGWNLEDPEEVIPEFTIEVGVPDYALFQDDSLLIFIEAKALGKLKDTDFVNKKLLLKSVSYAVTKGVPYLVVTDGDSWLVYDIYRRGSINEKQVVSWSIAQEDAVAIAFKALSIANLKPLILSLYGKERQVAEIISRATAKQHGTPQPTGTQQKPFKGPITSEMARRIILTILESEKRPLTIKEIFERAERIFEPTERDKAILSGKEERWKNQIRWELSKLTKEGIIKRVKEGTYTI